MDAQYTLLVCTSVCT